MSSVPNCDFYVLPHPCCFPYLVHAPNRNMNFTPTPAFPWEGVPVLSHMVCMRVTLGKPGGKHSLDLVNETL